MSETDLSRAVNKALKALGYPVVRVQAGTIRVGGRQVRLAEAGTPDRLVLLRGGRVLWLEIKTASGILSAEQVAWHLRAEKLGHAVRVVRSVSEAVAAVREVS